MFSRSNTSQNRLQSINLSIDIGVAIFIILLALFHKVTCRVSHMFLKIICWQILSWTQLHIVNLRVTSPCNIFFLSMSCVSRRYVRNFIDKNNFITRKNALEEFPLRQKYFPAIFQYSLVWFCYFFSMHIYHLTRFEIYDIF